MTQVEANQKAAKLMEIMTSIYEVRGFGKDIAKAAAADHVKWFMGVCKSHMQHFEQLIGEEIEDCEKGLAREMASL